MYQPRIINDKGRFILLWMFLCALPINAAPYLMTNTLKDDSVCIYREKVLFPKASAVVSGKFAGNQVHLDSIRSFFSKTGTQKPMSVKVTGSYSPEGKYLFNIKLAKARAQALADIIKRLDPSFTPAMSIEHPVWGGVLIIGSSVLQSCRSYATTLRSIQFPWTQYPWQTSGTPQKP